MAGFIKGITIEFGANTEKLNKALGNLQGRLNKTQAELKQVNRSLKFNPGNTTLLNQKFKLLQKSVTDTSRKLDGLRQMQARMKAQGIDENSAQYRQLQREIVKTENQLKQAEAEEQKAKTLYDYTVLQSPINGVVGNVALTKGNYVAPGNSPLLNIIQFDPIRVMFAIPDKIYLEEIKKYCSFFWTTIHQHKS